MRNNSSITVSICCATYNHVDYIAKALDSFLMQETNFLFEIIVHDDASTDGTTNIVKLYQKLYPEIIKPIIQIENKYSQGIGIHLNYIWPNAKGKFIAQCEGDDYWIDPHKLQMQVDILESDQSIALVHTNCDLLYEKSSKAQRVVTANRNPDFCSFVDPFDGILKGIYSISTLTVVIRTSFLLREINSGIYNVSRRLGDLPLWLAITRHHPISYIDKSTSVYRVRAESLSRSKNIVKQVEFLLDSKLTRLEFAQKYSSDCNLIKSLADSYNHLLIRQAYHHSNPEQAILAYSKLNSRLPLRVLFQYLCLTNNFVRFILGIPILVRRWFLRLFAM